jgi:hypothetical protein
LRDSNRGRLGKPEPPGRDQVTERDMHDNSPQPNPRKPLVARLSWATARPEALWDAWAFAAVEAELALDAWLKAAHSLKEATFAAYHAALDREEQAAAELAARLAPSRGAA